jgi:hypothetical protein
VNDARSCEDAVRAAFEAARAVPGAPYEDDRFLAFLTEPPAPSGRRVRDTFAARRRFVRFVHAVQLDCGMCLANEEWERGYRLDDFVSLVAKKAENRGATIRLVRERFEYARRRLWFAPIVLGVFLLPLLALAVTLPSLILRVLAGLLWFAVVGALLALGAKDIAYHRVLLRRLETKPG